MAKSSDQSRIFSDEIGKFFPKFARFHDLGIAAKGKAGLYAKDHDYIIPSLAFTGLSQGAIAHGGKEAGIQHAD